MTERNDYIRAPPRGRSLHASRLTDLAAKSLARLEALSTLTENALHRDDGGPRPRRSRPLSDSMWELMQVTIRNDRLIAEMGERAASLVELTDKARERQHASNTDIIASLTRGRPQAAPRARHRRPGPRAPGGDRDHRPAGGAAREQRARQASRSGSGGASSSFELHPAAQHGQTISPSSCATDGKAVVGGRADRSDALASRAARSASRSGSKRAGEAIRRRRRRHRWVERLIKVNSTEQRALHEEVAQLLTYSVNAAETEQATQNIAIATLKLGRRTADALASRDVAAARRDPRRQPSRWPTTVSSLPISPLIQSEMIDAIAHWREGLATTARGPARRRTTSSPTWTRPRPT